VSKEPPFFLPPYSAPSVAVTAVPNVQRNQEISAQKSNNWTHATRRKERAREGEAQTPAHTHTPTHRHTLTYTAQRLSTAKATTTNNLL